MTSTAKVTACILVPSSTCCLTAAMGAPGVRWARRPPAAQAPVLVAVAVAQQGAGSSHQRGRWPATNSAAGGLGGAGPIDLHGPQQPLGAAWEPPGAGRFIRVTALIGLHNGRLLALPGPSQMPQGDVERPMHSAQAGRGGCRVLAAVSQVAICRQEADVVAALLQC